MKKFRILMIGIYFMLMVFVGGVQARPLTNVPGSACSEHINAPIHSQFICDASIDQVVIHNLGNGTNTVLQNGGTYYTTSLPTNWNIEAQISGSNVHSVKFIFTGGYSGTTIGNAAPFRSPDSNTALNLGPASYTIAVLLYSSSYFGVRLCQKKIITFSIIGGECELAVDAGDPQFLCPLSKLRLSPLITGASSCGISAIPSYQWSGPGIIGVSNYSYAIVNQPGTYTLVVSDCQGCTATDSVVIIGDLTPPDFDDNQQVLYFLNCGDGIPLIQPTASDYLGPVSYSFRDLKTCTQPNAYCGCTHVRMWSAIDQCGYKTEFKQSFIYKDENAPVFTFIPIGDSLNCDEVAQLELAIAQDECGSAIVSFSDVITPGNCPNSYTMLRTFRALDNCGNEAMVEVSYFIFDHIPPQFGALLTDVFVDCIAELPAPQEVTATDYCGEAMVEMHTEAFQPDLCGNQLFRVWYTATDECQNVSAVEYYIHVQDETAPIFDSQPSDLTIACGADYPAAPEVTATDNCLGEVFIEMDESYEGGYTPAEGAVASCQLLTPVRIPVNPCEYPVDWAMALLSLPLQHRYYLVTAGQFDQYPDNSIHLVATMRNTNNPANGFFVDVKFVNGLNWSDWSTQSFFTSYKADCGAIAANHSDWTYYLLDNANSTLTGFGAYSGSILNLTHAPSNNFYGFQLGNGANNYNAVNDGFGGWFQYNGALLINGQQVTGINFFTGDFALQLDCCPNPSMVRCWTATDCSGNLSQQCQTIFVESDAEEVSGILLESLGNPMSLRVSVSPNPSTYKTLFTVTATESGHGVLEVFDLMGTRVAQLIQAQMDAGQPNRVELDVSKLSAGIYLYRFSSGFDTEMGRMIVGK